MHHYPYNQEQATNLSITQTTRNGHARPRIQPKASNQSVNPYYARNPSTLTYEKRLEESQNWISSLPHRHCLMFGLGRCLIVFDPLILVIDQWTHNWQLLSQQLVFNKSKNFTFDYKPVIIAALKNSWIQRRPKFHIPCTAHHRLGETRWTTLRSKKQRRGT